MQVLHRGLDLNVSQFLIIKILTIFQQVKFYNILSQNPWIRNDLKGQIRSCIKINAGPQHYIQGLKDQSLNDLRKLLIKYRISIALHLRLPTVPTRVCWYCIGAESLFPFKHYRYRTNLEDSTK
jgi:hypothetical protein